MSPLPAFTDLAADPSAPLDQLALALAAEFRDIDAGDALARLDLLGAATVDALADAGATTPAAEVAVLADVLARANRFRGDRKRYDHPDNSMLDIVLVRRRGLPILVSAVYVEVARRAGVGLAGIGLPGHFVAGHMGAEPPLLIDPFSGGGVIEPPADARDQVRPWTPHETVMRMLNNLVGTYGRRGDIGRAIHAAELRLVLPADPELHATLDLEHRRLAARMN